VILGVLRFCIEAAIVYIVFLLMKDLARILFGKHHARHQKPRVVVQQPPGEKETYNDVRNAKFKEQQDTD
jgi:hypothetical protein